MRRTKHAVVLTDEQRPALRTLVGRGTARILDGEREAHLVALACSTPSEGRARWSLRLLADELVRLEVVANISHETVRQT